MNTSNLTRGINIIREAALAMPNAPGIYKMMDASGAVLYLGKAKLLPKRVLSYTITDKLPYRLKMMVSQVAKIEALKAANEAEALLLEATLIKSLQPKYNVLLKDDKSFPYIAITHHHRFPRIAKYRGKPKADGDYYGPFASAAAVNQSIAELQKAFKLRPCSDSYFASRTKPCLQYQINRCSAPCVGKISEADYAANIGQAKAVLEGKNLQLQDKLQQEMLAASAQQQYELAGVLRDRIKVLREIQAGRAISSDISADVWAIYQDELGDCCAQVFFIRYGQNFGNQPYYFHNQQQLPLSQLMEQILVDFYQDGPKTSNLLLSHVPCENHNNRLLGMKLMKANSHTAGVLEFALDNAKQSLRQYQRQNSMQLLHRKALQDRFNLASPPSYIEVYDNSHLQGQEAFGCYISWLDGKFAKNLYRALRIKDTSKPDDYAMLAETLTRRFARLNPACAPDLLLIDGGAGHLSCALQTLAKLNWQVDLICMAKGEDRNSGREFFHQVNRTPFQLPLGDPALAFLHQLRNEAHRFAISAHRRGMLRAIDKSGLDAIPGIGRSRRIALLHHFGSAKAVKEASTHELQKVPGINSTIAQNIFNYLHASDD